MARKKGSSDFEEAPDEASVEAKVTDEGYDDDEPQPANVEPTLMSNPRVNIKDEPAKEEAPVGESTKAEQEAGKKAVEEAEKNKQIAREANEKAAKGERGENA